MNEMDKLYEQIKQCEVCKEHLPLGPRPIVQLSSHSKIVIIGQAPGRKVHETGIPWNDASGKKLKTWLGVDDAAFYNAGIFSIMPMGFCYPGKAPSGDMPPRPECAPLWHPQILSRFDNPPLLLLIGQYAINYYLKKEKKSSLTETVKHFRDYLPKYFPMPHPSPRNQYWLKINPWFTEEAIPTLQHYVKLAIEENIPTDGLSTT